MTRPNIIDLDLAATANCLRLIGHPNRLAIVLHLARGACLVSELEATLKLHQPNLSQHLGLLREANILVSRRQAKTVMYALQDGISRALIDAVALSLETTQDDGRHGDAGLNTASAAAAGAGAASAAALPTVLLGGRDPVAGGTSAAAAALNKAAAAIAPAPVLPNRRGDSESEEASVFAQVIRRQPDSAG